MINLIDCKFTSISAIKSQCGRIHENNLMTFLKKDKLSMEQSRAIEHSQILLTHINHRDIVPKVLLVLHNVLYRIMIMCWYGIWTGFWNEVGSIDCKGSIYSGGVSNTFNAGLPLQAYWLEKVIVDSGKPPKLKHISWICTCTNCI